MFRHHLGALALVAAFALPLAASAQTAPDPGVAPAPAAQSQHAHHHHNRFMHAVRGLGLSAAQKQQIAGIFKSARSANETAGADPQTRRANARAMRRQIEGVLTDAQRTQLHAKLAQGRPNMKAGNPAGQAPTQ